MPWREEVLPRRMARIAVVAPDTRWRRVLAEVGAAGVVEPDGIDVTSAAAVDPELDRLTAVSVASDGVRAIVGWAPAGEAVALGDRLAPLGGAVVELPAPPGRDPPTLLGRDTAGAPLRPLVDTYAVVPYRDVDPTWFAAAAYVVMFGMMFGDIGDAVLLVAAGLWLRRTRRPRLAGIRRAWALIVALGVSAILFGALYGELFGPVVPALWVRPLDDPTRLLALGIGIGAGLLAVAYGLGVVNRWREGGARLAVYSPTGIAGAALFVGFALVAVGVLAGWAWLWGLGLGLAAVAIFLVAVGLRSGAGPGAAGALQASVESMDVVIRLGSNVVSFARLAAFGLMHAALAKVVWDAATSLWAPGPVAALAALVFVVGHVVAFGLEALVAGVQALRLEYYELFSRVFVAEGRPYRPWRVAPPSEEESCSPG